MPQPIRLWPDDSSFLRDLSSDPDYEAEIKYNGWRLEIHNTETGPILFNRKGTEIGNLEIDKFVRAFRNLPPNSVFDGELINFRTKDVKNIVIIWDCMFWNGRDIRKLQLQERRQFLDTLKVAPVTLKSKSTGQVYRAKSRKTGLLKFYDKIVKKDDPLEEGIVIKNIRSRYEYSVKASFETVSWFKLKKIGAHALNEV